MPNTDSHAHESTTLEHEQQTRSTNALPSNPALSWRSYRDLFAIPPPVKRVFDRFPLTTYGSNSLPLRAPTERDKHVLHVFTTDEDARAGRPSFNPACLRWQTFLKFNDISFESVKSSNHASPSGALPFLLPSIDDSAQADPLPSNKLRKWIATQQSGEQKKQEPEDLRYEAYTSLLDHRIRKAWLFQLYLNPANTSTLRQLYVEPCSSNIFVQMTILHQLRRAAEAELAKASAFTVLTEDDIMRDAHEAFEALSELLGGEEWFFALEKPGWFDASVFAYTHLLLDGGLQWGNNRVGEGLAPYPNLLSHHRRVAQMYY